MDWMQNEHLCLPIRIPFTFFLGFLLAHHYIYYSFSKMKFPQPKDHCSLTHFMHVHVEIFWEFKHVAWLCIITKFREGIVKYCWLCTLSSWKESEENKSEFLALIQFHDCQNAFLRLHNEDIRQQCGIISLPNNNKKSSEIDVEKQKLFIRIIRSICFTPTQIPFTLAKEVREKFARKLRFIMEWFEHLRFSHLEGNQLFVLWHFDCIIIESLACSRSSSR